MSVKQVYFVRHGQTDGNIGDFWQGPEQPLNQKGHIQAESVAQRAKGITFDRLLCSSMLRAQQTAEHIAEASNCLLETNDLFREIKDPTSVTGPDNIEEKQLAITQYRAERDAHHSDGSWHFEDEENSSDFLMRVKKSLDFLKEQNEENILVVSHGTFLRAVIGLIVQEGEYKNTDLRKFVRSITTSNTGIIVLRYENDQWRLLTWNDHSHFAE